MGLPETLKGVRLGGCRFTAAGWENRFLTPTLGKSAHMSLTCALPRPAAPPYNLDEGGGAPARGTHTLSPKP